MKFNAKIAAATITPLFLITGAGTLWAATQPQQTPAQEDAALKAACPDFVQTVAASFTAASIETSIKGGYNTIFKYTNSTGYMYREDGLGFCILEVVNKEGDVTGKLGFVQPAQLQDSLTTDADFLKRQLVNAVSRNDQYRLRDKGLTF